MRFPLHPAVRQLVLAGVAAASLLAAAPAHALDQLPVISLDLAQKMAAGCQSYARERGWRMTLAVVDAGANPVLLQRMDRAILASIDLALDKAKTSAKFPFPTRFAAELAYGKDGKPGAVPGFNGLPGIVTFAGGLPVMAGKVHIGGVGASGGLPDEDEQCAKAALDAVADQLK